jgi:hypothetical protein
MLGRMHRANFSMSLRATARLGWDRPENTHHVTAFRIEAASGALSAHGDPIPLPTRPIHMTTDIPSEHLLVAFSNPSGIRVYRINPDATPGGEVVQPGPIDPGIYGHQVRVSPHNELVILVTRRHDAAGGMPEEHGALLRDPNRLPQGSADSATNRHAERHNSADLLRGFTFCLEPPISWRPAASCLIRSGARGIATVSASKDRATKILSCRRS